MIDPCVEAKGESNDAVKPSPHANARLGRNLIYFLIDIPKVYLSEFF